MARRLSTKDNGDNGAGHNGIPGNIDAGKIDKYVERVARLKKDQKELGLDITEICRDAQDKGVITAKALRKLANERLNPQDVADELDYLDRLRFALKQLAGTPLGNAAEKAAKSRNQRQRTSEEALAAAREHLGSESLPAP